MNPSNNERKAKSVWDWLSIFGFEPPKTPNKNLSKGKKILNWLFRAMGGILILSGIVVTIWAFKWEIGLMLFTPGLVLVKLGGGKLKDYFELG